MPKCQVTYDVLSLGEEYAYELGTLGGALYEKYSVFMMNGENAKTAIELKNLIVGIIDFIKDKAPFCYFDSNFSKQVVKDSAECGIDKLIPFVLSYIYLCNDTYTFFHIAVRYFDNVVKKGCRNKTELAQLALVFFSDEQIQRTIDRLRDVPLNEAVSFRPHTSTVPAFGLGQGLDVTIKRRVYYTRMLDFFISDMFDGLACGHYVWRCGYCGRYFHMTTAHKQLYCQTPPPGKKHPCSVLAKHHATATNESKKRKQSVKDNPLYVAWKRRDAAIRKVKSRGTYPADVCDRARAYIKDCYERALSDAKYAQTRFESDIEGDKIFNI